MSNTCGECGQWENEEFSTSKCEFHPDVSAIKNRRADNYSRYVAVAVFKDSPTCPAFVEKNIGKWTFKPKGEK